MSMCVIPSGDLFEHEDSNDCACGPTQLETVTAGGRHLGWIAVHHALDGRELNR